MNVNPIVTTGNVPEVTPQTTEAPETQPVTPAGSQPENQVAAQETAKAAQPAVGQTNTTAQAVMVALEGAISTELNELANMLANRTELVNRLPSEIKELVKTILTQSQSAQDALPAGLAALLKSPKTITEKLDLLAGLLEEAAGLPAKVDKQAAVMTAGKQQIPMDLIETWRNSQPEELKAAAKALQELIQLATQPAVPAAKEQDAPGAAKFGQPPVQTAAVIEDGQPALLGQTAQGGQDAPAAAAQPEQKGLPTAAPPKAGSEGGSANQLAEGNGKQSAAAQPAAGDGQPLPADSANSAAHKPANQIDAKTAPGQQVPVASEGKEQATARFTTATQQEGLTSKQQSHSEAIIKPSSAMVSEQERTMLLKTMASRPDLIKSLPPEIKEAIQTILRQNANPKATANLPEPLARLISTQQPATEKLTLLATVLSESASLPRAGRQSGAQQDQTLAEIVTLLQTKNPEEVKVVAMAVRELADAMPKPGGLMAERQDSQSVLSFTIPLTFGDGQIVYPAHIHVFHQQEEDKKNPGQHVTETWLRICLETENLGMVETAFHLYDGETLDVKVRFADQEAADSFAESADEVKAQLSQLPLNLGEFLVR